MSEVWVGVVGLIVLLGLFLTGFELGIAMGFVGFLGFSYVKSVHTGLSVVAQDIFATLSSYGFTVIPLFILMGQIAFNAGIAKKLYDSGNKFVGHIRAAWQWGLSGRRRLRGALRLRHRNGGDFCQCCDGGDGARFGYDRRLSTGIVATVGTLGILVPPSGVLIIFGMITEQSIGKLFLAGLVPGLLITVFFIAIIYGWCRMNPSLGPTVERSSWKSRMESLPRVLGSSSSSSWSSVG